MLLQDYIKNNEKIRGIAGMRSKFISASHIIVKIQDLTETEKTKIVEDSEESKLLFYQLESDIYLFNKFSYPMKRYFIRNEFNLNKFGCTNRSKKFVEFFANKIEEITSKPVNIHTIYTKDQRFPSSFLNKLPSRTEILFSSCSKGNIQTLLEKTQYSNNTKILLNSAQPEKKNIRKPMTIFKDIKETIRRFNLVYPVKDKIYNKENVSYLLKCRMDSNPVKQSSESVS